MQFAKRIFLFMLTNVLIVATISIVTSLLGLQPYLHSQGLNIESLAVFCAIWGFGGALISLALSRIMAKMMMGVKVIDPNTTNRDERWLLEKVHNLSRMAGLPKMPEVGIYNSPEINAFATGPTKSRALVAVSSGLFQRMNEKEVEGVLGHEVAHIANGDMVTMTLLQGLVNAFVMFIARIIAFAVSQQAKEESRPMIRFAVTIVLEIALSFLGMLVIAYFSRQREFRADKGGAKYAGRDSMIAALEKLKSAYSLNAQVQSAHKQDSVATMKISSKRSGGLLALMSTHPDLDTRIRRLQTQTSA
ncbi:MAG: protease HtpX [Proteobacteria bacterium]|jgi:heat shock protein HtpX|nr:protease HtpX [Pseudomonadota bacterium]